MSLSDNNADENFILSHHHLIYPLTARVVGALQMISLPVSSIFPCSPLPSRTRLTPGLSIPSCCLPTSSSVCLVFFPLSLCLARWFSPDLMNGRHDHTTAVCVSLQWSGGLRAVRLPAGCWHGLQHISGHGEQGKMEKTGCKIICGAPTMCWVKYVEEGG